MQFRIKTLLVIVTILVFTLAFSSFSSPGRRIGLLLAVAALWLTCGLTAQSLRSLVPPLQVHRVLLALASLTLAAVALSSTVLLMSLILHDRFQPALGGN